MGSQSATRFASSAWVVAATGAALLAVARLGIAGPIEDLRPGEWYRVPDSKLDSVLPSPIPIGDNRAGTPTSIIDEWSGGAYDTTRERLIVWGGGHNNYSGNELYAFDLATLRWQRLTDPSSDVGGSESSGYYPDGRPRSRHTYEYIEYVPSIDRFCSFGGAAQFPSATGSVSNVDCFDFDRGVWETTRYRDVPRTQFESLINAVTAYDPVSGYLYLHTTPVGNDPHLMRWTPGMDGADRWEILTGYDWIEENMTGEIDPERRVMVAVGMGRFHLWDLNNPMAGDLSPPTSGATAIESEDAPGLAYDPVSKTIVAWSGGANVYTLSFNATNGWNWTLRPPAPTNTVIPTAAVSVGTYGRFRYIPSRNVFIVVNDIHQDVYIYRLSTGTGSPPPTVNLNANPTSVPPNGTATLDWTSGNATSCTASGAWSGSRSTSGSQNVGPMTTTSTFTLSCSGSGGTASDSATVTVTQAPPGMPVVNLSASPQSVMAGGSTTLSWSSQNASGCAASGAWSGNKATSGTEAVGPLNSNSNFTLQCTGSGGSASATANVTVTAGGGGGGSTTQSGSGGGGSLSLLTLVAMLLVRLLTFVRRQPARPTLASFGMALLAVSGCATVNLAKAAVTDFTAVSVTSSAQTDVPVTFGQVFKPGDVPSGTSLIARLPSGAQVPLQLDRKTAYADGSAKHGVVSVILPSLGGNTSQLVNLDLGTATAGTAVSVSDLLATAFDATVALNVDGTSYSASARDFLQNQPRTTWLTGPVASEWVVSGPVRTAAGAAHAHLQAQFAIRAYRDLRQVRVSVTVENIFTRVAAPQRFTYDVNVTVQGKGTVLTRSAVPHYNQSRWRRVFWWGPDALADVRHNSAYLAATRAVPTYDSRIQMSGGTLDDLRASFRANSDLMDIGDLNPNMPAGGGRGEIAPVPLFAAAYLITTDLRAKESMIGHGDQAGAWPMHYRDENTGLPVSLDTYPNISILGDSGLPACGGTCTSPYEPEVAHHPSLAYVPYLVTGDYYLLEELQFWADWVMFYGESSRHGGAQGLIVWDGIRGQAWAMRTIAQAAYATPDSHPLKSYFNAKLQNNINFFNTTWLNSNPLGYITHTGPMEWTGLRQWVATWMDDFLTWSFGHIVALGYDQARPMLEWKAKFPVGRLTDPNMCWILASTYWPTVMDNFYLGGTGQPVDTWDEWRRIIIWSWNNDAFKPPSINIAGREQELINASCNSSQMQSILGLSSGYMIGWDGADGYGANMQPAVAVAIEAGVPNAQAAFDRLLNAASFPANGYNSQPQWDIVPATAAANAPNISFSASPTSVQAGGNSTLTWSATNATSCTASGGWSGTKATSGSQSVGPINTSTDYVLSCSNATASSSRSVTVAVATPPPPAPTVTLNANPLNVASGGSTQLTWSSTNANSCTASGGWSGTKATSGNQTISNLTNNTMFTLQCTGGGGSAQQSVTVTVTGAPPAPTVTLSANPTTVGSGQSSALTWSSTNATSCTASGGWSGTKATSGNQSTGALSATTMFTLACTGSGGTAQRSVTVTVSSGPAAPTVTLNANPTAVNVNGTSTLTWSSTNATSCTASGGWTGSKSTSGTETTGALSNTTSYTLSCTGAGGNAQQSVTVTVNAGGGGGGGSSPPEGGSGGGSFGWLSLGVLALIARRRFFAFAPLAAH
jgi:hypothetical protein